MSELLDALKRVEELEKKNKELFAAAKKSDDENFMLKNNLQKEYPFFMFVKKGTLNHRNLIYKHRDNYYSDRPCTLSELRERMFNDVYKFLRELEK